MNYFACTNCGFWQKLPTSPQNCPICSDFRHTPPDGSWQFTSAEEAALQVLASWREDQNGVTIFSCEPNWGIGPSGYLIPHASGNIWVDGCGWYSDEALSFIENRGGIGWICPTHPHTYGALWRLQNRFSPHVCVAVNDLSWTNSFNTNWPFDDALDIAPDVRLVRSGGHFDGHSVLHWASKNILFAGDLLKTHYEGGELVALSTHKGFNRQIPMSHTEIGRYHDIIAPLEFSQIYTSFDCAPVSQPQVLALFDALLKCAPFCGPIPLSELS